MSDVAWLDFNSAAPQGLAQSQAAPSPPWERQESYDRDEVRASLIGQLESVLGYLYPHGFTEPKGRTFYIGNVNGDPGESLNVVLRGERAGLWHDFATGDGGDIFDLWQAARGLPSFRETIKDAALYSGAASTTPRRMPKRRQPSGGDAWGVPAATYRYTDANGSVIAEVDRFEWEKDGKREKAFRPWDVTTRRHRAPETRPLYNLPNITSAPEIVIVEGEKAADALIAQNIDATTAMGGASAPIEKTDWSVMRGRMVVIWPDNDDAGRSYAERLKAYLESEAGAASVTILNVPANRPEKWDAADAEDEDLGALVRAMRGATSEAQTGLVLEQWSDLQDVQVQWLIGGLIPHRALAALYGKPGAYKSFVALYIAAMVATGGDCFFRRTHSGRVVYVMAEGGAGAFRRAKALEKQHGFSNPDVTFLRSALDLRGSMEDANRLIAAINETGDAPILIIIDTLARNFGGGNENSSEDMGAFISVVGHLQDRLGCAALVVHHSGKDDAKGMRGHSSLFGAVDTELEVVKVSDEDDPRRIGEITVTKQKDGEDGFSINYEMPEIDLGGEKTSLAVQPIDEEFKKLADISPTAATFLHHIEAFFAEPNSHQIYPPMDGMPPMKTTNAKDVRDWCRAREGHDTYTPAAFRQRWARALRDLRAAGKVGTWEDKLWLI